MSADATADALRQSDKAHSGSIAHHAALQQDMPAVNASQHVPHNADKSNGIAGDVTKNLLDEAMNPVTAVKLDPETQGHDEKTSAVTGKGKGPCVIESSPSAGDAGGDRSAGAEDIDSSSESSQENMNGSLVGDVRISPPASRGFSVQQPIGELPQPISEPRALGPAASVAVSSDRRRIDSKDAKEPQVSLEDKTAEAVRRAEMQAEQRMEESRHREVQRQKRQQRQKAERETHERVAIESQRVAQCEAESRLAGAVPPAQGLADSDSDSSSDADGSARSAGNAQAHERHRSASPAAEVDARKGLAVCGSIEVDSPAAVEDKQAVVKQEDQLVPAPPGPPSHALAVPSQPFPPTFPPLPPDDAKAATAAAQAGPMPQVCPQWPPQWPPQPFPMSSAEYPVGPNPGPPFHGLPPQGQVMPGPMGQMWGPIPAAFGSAPVVGQPVPAGPLPSALVGQPVPHALNQGQVWVVLSEGAKRRAVMLDAKMTIGDLLADHGELSKKEGVLLCLNDCVSSETQSIGSRYPGLDRPILRLRMPST